MTSSPENSIGFYLEENFTYTKDKETLPNQMNEVYQKIARASNAKEIARYEEIETLTGQRFPGATPQTKKSIYRKVFIFGAIASGATLNIAHGLTGVTSYTRVYGTITDGTNHYPLPRVSATLITDQVSLDIIGANIRIINGATAVAVTSGFVILEFQKQ